MGSIHSDASVESLWNLKSGKTLAVLGPEDSGIKTISTEINARIKRGDLPFASLVDKQELFFEHIQRYFGRGRASAYDIDRRAKAMARLGALILVIDSTNLSSMMSMKLLTKHSKDEYSPAQYETMPENFLSTIVDNQIDVLINKPILVYCNKRDLPKSVPAEKIRNCFFTKYSTGFNIRIQESVAINNEGIEEGIKWLIEQMDIIQKRKLILQWNKPKLNKTLTISKLEKYSNQPPEILKISQKTNNMENSPETTQNDKEMDGGSLEKSVSVISTVMKILL